MATWKILSLQYDNNSGEDKLIALSAAEGVDGVGFARKVFTNTLTGVVGPDPLTPYDSLTEAQVVALVQAAIGPTEVAAAEVYVDAQATAKRTSIEDLPTNTGLPWS